MNFSQLQQYFRDNHVKEATLCFNYGGTVTLDCRLGTLVEEIELVIDDDNPMLAYETLIDSQSFPLRVFHG